MGRPVQDIRINALQHRAKERHRKRWIVRWSVDGRQRSKSFATQSEASRYRSLLIEAHRRGEVFDRGVCEPASWLPSAEGVQVHVWAQRWLAEQWPEWQPRTRDSAVEGAARFVPLMVGRNASAPPEGLRRYLKARLVPDVDVDEAHPCERWLARWSLQLHELDRATLADVDRQLAVGDAGQPLSPSSTARFRKLARACIRRAVELDILTVDP